MYFYAGEQIFLFFNAMLLKQSYAMCQLQPYSNKCEIWLKVCTLSAVDLQFTVRKVYHALTLSFMNILL